jgi:hypothetical protein
MGGTFGPSSVPESWSPAWGRCMEKQHLVPGKEHSQNRESPRIRVVLCVEANHRVRSAQLRSIG